MGNQELSMKIVCLTSNSSLIEREVPLNFDLTAAVLLALLPSAGVYCRCGRTCIAAGYER